MNAKIRGKRKSREGQREKPFGRASITSRTTEPGVGNSAKEQLVRVEKLVQSRKLLKDGEMWNLQKERLPNDVR